MKFPLLKKLESPLRALENSPKVPFWARKAITYGRIASFPVSDEEKILSKAIVPGYIAASWLTVPVYFYISNGIRLKKLVSDHKHVVQKLDQMVEKGDLPQNSVIPKYDIANEKIKLMNVSEYRADIIKSQQGIISTSNDIAALIMGILIIVIGGNAIKSAKNYKAWKAYASNSNPVPK